MAPPPESAPPYRNLDPQAEIDRPRAALVAAEVELVGLRNRPHARGAPAWEYHIVCISDYDVPAANIEFNRLGAEGWELVTATDDGAFFKRPAGAR